MKNQVCMIAYTGYAGDARVRREAETLVLNGYAVSFLVPKAGDRPRSYTLDGVEVVELNVRQYCGKSQRRYFLSYFAFLVRSFFACSARCLRGKIDVVHVHNMPNFLVFATILPRLAGKKVILDIHDTMPETYLAKFGNGAKPDRVFKLFCIEEAICSKLANRLVAVNHTQKAALVGRGIAEQKVAVSLNVPDHRRFVETEDQRTSQDPGSAFKLIYHGTLAKRLGVDLAIRAFAELAEKIPEIEFNILGVGDDETEFRSIAEELNLGSRIRFGGFVPIDNLLDALKGMQVGVVPNRKSLASELMLPVKMLEYVGLGIPVVVPRLTAIQHYFNDDMVRFYEPESVSDLARAIFDLHADPALRERQVTEARKFLERYGWERHHKDLLDLYQSL